MAKKKKTRKQSDQFWVDLLIEYVAKNKSLAEIARTHEVSYSTLVKRARAEDWRAERSDYRQNVVRKALNRESNKQVRHYRSLLAATGSAIEKIRTALDDANAQEYIFAAGTEKERKSRQINTEFMREMVDLIDRTREVADAQLGILEEGHLRALEIEEAKATGQAASDGAGEGSGGGVIILPTIETKAQTPKAQLIVNN